MFKQRKIFIFFFLFIFSFFDIKSQETNLKGLSKIKLKEIINELGHKNDSLLKHYHGQQIQLDSLKHEMWIDGEEYSIKETGVSFKKWDSKGGRFAYMKKTNLKGLSKMRLKLIINEVKNKNDSLLKVNIQNKKLYQELKDSYETLTKVDSLNLIFMGDIMGHDSQIKSAYNKKTNTYNYDSVFEEVKDLISNADFAIANLEVTLAGPPFKGYPRFSSPKDLAVSCKKSGIDVLVTSNNHTCDRGKKGIIRTLDILDSLEIKHTGSFRDSLEFKKNNLLVLEKNNIKVGLLNYTFSTNGIAIPYPTIVNKIDTIAILKDIKKSKTQELDKLIVFIHWGPEYQSKPSNNQKKIAKFLFNNGVDIIIGAHPHVLQKMEYFTDFGEENAQLIAYSLGNYVSNQRDRKKDGGAMIELTITKNQEKTKIIEPYYHLTWVHKPIINGKKIFKILPCEKYERNEFKDLDLKSKNAMKLFIADSRKLLGKENKNITEK